MNHTDVVQGQDTYVDLSTVTDDDLASALPPAVEVSHANQARAHLAAVAETREYLRTLYANHDPKVDNTKRIAAAHQSIGYGLKAAHIHATLAIAEAVRA